MGQQLPQSKSQFSGLFLWFLFLVAVFLVGAVLNWHRSLIGTEIWALYYGGRPFAEQIAAVRADLVHPPFFYIVERAWLALFGQTDNVAKAYSVFISIPTFFLITLLARRVTPYWRLLSFLLVGVYLRFGSVPTQIRMYGLGILLVVSSILLWDNWRTNPRNSTLIAWTCISLLLVYTHLFGSLVVFAFVVVNWIFGQRKWTFTIAAALCGLLFLPWVLYVVPVYLNRGLEPNLTWVHQSLTGAIADFNNQLLGVVDTTTRRQNLLVSALALLVNAALLPLAWTFRYQFWPVRGENEDTRRWFWSAALLTAIPVAILLLFSLMVARAFEARFVLGVLPSYWIAVLLLCQLSGRAGRIVMLAVLLPWKLVSIGSAVSANWQPDWPRQATTFVSQQAQPDDVLLACDSDTGNSLYWEWTRRLHRSARLETLPSTSPIAQRMSVLKPVGLEQLDLHGVSRFWVFFAQSETKSKVSEYLSARGFAPSPQPRSATPHLLLFVKLGSS